MKATPLAQMSANLERHSFLVVTKRAAANGVNGSVHVQGDVLTVQHVVTKADLLAWLVKQQQQ